MLLLPAAVLAKDGKDQFKRTIDVSYPVSDGAALNVSNKYGKIILHTWNKKEVKATVVITGFGKNAEESKSITESVDVNINHSESAVSFQTNYMSNGRGWLSWSGKKDSKDYVNIDYEVYVPTTIGQLAIGNNFGDVITDDLPCSLKLTMNYCYYDIRSVSGTLDANMNYCTKGKFGKVGNMRARANYSTIKLDAVNTLDAKSNYCEYVIENVNELLVSANYDDYTITKVGRLQSNTTYSDFKIGTLTQDADVKLVYSDVKIKELGANFKGINGRGTYSNISVWLSDRLDVKVEGDLNHGDVNITGLSMKNVNSTEKSGHVNYSGRTNASCSACPVIRLTGVYSDLTVKGK
ncbi:hypothetical protein DCM91_12850 [Chitinophaga costaii]|nr:hypothetical protein DCM91_12850 [Chitinophaga costaii]